MFAKKSLITLMFAGLLSATAQAATFELNSGQSLQGEIVSQDDSHYLLDMQGLEVKVPKEQVVSVDLSEASDSSKEVMGAEEPAATSQASAASASSAEPDGAVQLPIGTVMTVRMTESINSRHHQAGHTFTAELEADLVNGGEVIAPRGARVYGELIDAKKSRRMAGTASMSLQLTGVMIDNQIQPIETQVLSGEGDNTIKDSAGKTARAAAIGGLIDGSDGARNGAKVGVGASLLTGGNDIQVPQGSLIEFQLSQPLTM